MNLLARAVRFLFWFLVISGSAWLLRRFLGWWLQKAAAHSEPSVDVFAADPMPGAGRRLRRDPICGMHVDETLSIPLRDRGELLHFCSTACRDQYRISAQKFAANG